MTTIAIDYIESFKCCSVVDPGFSKGGGINNGCLLSLRTHIYHHQKPKGVRWSRNSASPFIFLMIRAISPFLSRTTHIRCHFQSSTKAKTRYMSIFLHISFLFLKTTPTSNPNGGHTIHACSFSYGATPNSGPKGGGGGMCLKYPPRSTYVMLYIMQWFYCTSSVVSRAIFKGSKGHLPPPPLPPPPRRGPAPSRLS